MSPKVIINNGQVITSPKMIADNMNKGFIDRNTQLHRSIPNSAIDPIENFEKLTQGNNLKFQLKTITTTQLDTIIHNLKSSNSTSTDLISSKTIKKLYKVLKYPLLNLVNLTIETAEYPKALKKRKVILLLKKKHPLKSSPTEQSTYYQP